MAQMAISSLQHAPSALIQKLDAHKIRYSENSIPPLRYVTINLEGQAKQELSSYFAILVEPYIGIMLYDENEDELIPVTSNQGAVLDQLIKSYGEPFLLIKKFIKEWQI